MSNETNKEFTLEELKAEYAKTLTECEKMYQMIEEKQKEEDDRKKAQLALEKDKRKKAIEEKEKELAELIADYIKDYGSYNYRYDKHDGDEDAFSYLYHLFF